jgi:hypothetical protein
MEQHRQVWNDRLDRLEQHLRKIQQGTHNKEKPRE